MKTKLLSACAALIVIFTGCKKNSVKEFTPALDPELQGSLKIYGNYSNFESLEAEFDRFNEFYPGVKCTYTYLDSYNKSITPALNSEDAPDIFTTFPWLVSNDEYAHILDYAQNLADPSLNLDFSGIQQGLIYTDEKGSIPMMPVFSVANGMMVNEDLFAREGLKVPVTYDSLIQTCYTLVERGYTTPILSYNNEAGTFYIFAYQYFCKSLRDNPDAVKKLNALEPSAGQYMRPVLELVDNFASTGLLNTEECLKLKDNYNALILRFFEGDIPIVFLSGDSFSGTKKRESLSDAFSANPFTYTFHPIPTSNEDLCFYNTPALEFSVNKNSENLALADEFMRFLTYPGELDRMAESKRLITVTNSFDFDESYKALSTFETAYVQDVGILDRAVIQMRRAVFNVGNRTMTIDEAIDNFGNF